MGEMKVKLKERYLPNFYVNRLVNKLHNPHKSRQIVSSNDISESRIVENISVLSKVTSVEDIHVHSEISSVIENTSIDSCPTILNEIHMSSADTSDVVDALVDYIHTWWYLYSWKKSKESRNRGYEVESIPIVLSSSVIRVSYYDTSHQVSYDVSSFNVFGFLYWVSSIFVVPNTMLYH